MRRVLLTIFAFLFLGLSTAFGANSTTTGSCTPGSPAYPRVSFTSISVICQYSGDDNNNNSALIEYSLAGAGTWSAAIAPQIDRRAIIQNNNPNTHYHEFRVSIVGLTPNTAYDVRTTVSDTDGVTGTNPTTMSSVVTDTYTPPLGGSARTATDDSTLGALVNGAATLTAGDTITVSAGNYSAFTISRSVGNSGAWIKLICATPNACKISGVGATNITINANFWWVRGFELTTSDGTALRIGNNQNHVLVENITEDSVSTLCAVGLSSNTHYGDGGVTIGTGASNIYVRNNVIVASTGLDSAACTCSVSNPCSGGSTNIYDSPAAGVQMGSGDYNISIDGNTITGGFRDCVTLDDSVTGENEEEINNYCSGYKDDGIENKGDGPFLRMGSNIMYVYNANGAYGETFMAPTGEPAGDGFIPYGPIYVYRNTGRVKSGYDGAGAETVIKSGTGTAPIWFINNSFYTDDATGNWICFVNGGDIIFAANNICTTLNGHFIDTGTTTVDASHGMTFEYDLGYIRLLSNTYAKNWSGVSYGSNGVINGAPSFQSCPTPCQEVGGATGDPVFTNKTSNTQILQVSNGSPAWGTGIAIPNFAGTGTAWPPSPGNVAPNKGAFDAPGAAPVLTSMTPSTGAQSAVVPVTFTGTTLSTTTACGLTITGASGITASSVVCVNSTTVTATLTIAANAIAGVRTISLTTDNGASNALNFTVTTSGGGGGGGGGGTTAGTAVSVGGGARKRLGRK
jgi:hypothetical protein